MASPDGAALGLMRRVVFGIFIAALAGTGAELVLLEHTEGFWQRVPLVLIALALVAAVLLAAMPRRGIVRLFRVVMLLVFAGGMAGFVLHFMGNLEFERELNPGIAGMELVWETLKGATPALAPGMFLVLAALGFATTLNHPAIASRTRSTHIGQKT